MEQKVILTFLQSANPLLGNCTDTFHFSRPAGNIKPAYTYRLAGTENPSLTIAALEITYPPDGSTPPHRHGTASVIGYVLEGEVLSAMNDEEAKVYKPGESWYEAPGCHHRIADNNSKTEGVKMVATFVVETEIFEKEGWEVLVQIDPEYAEDAKQQMQGG